MCSSDLFPSHDMRAEERINSVDWNLVAAMIYACKEADEYEKKLKHAARKVTKGKKSKSRKQPKKGLPVPFHFIKKTVIFVKIKFLFVFAVSF